MVSEAGRHLNGEALRSLFSNGFNTYLIPVQRAEGVAFHRRSELFRLNGTYWRGMGRTGIEGWYGLEGDELCVWGDSIARQCRKVLPQGGAIYLLIDVTNNSQALMELSQRK